MKANNKNSAGNSKPIPNNLDSGRPIQKSIWVLAGRWKSQLIVSVVVIFVMLSLLDEVLDLPHLLVGAPHTPINWAEIAIDVTAMLSVGFFFIFMLSGVESKRKRAERTLKRERDFSQSILETANSMIVCLDGDAKITVFNQECERITGYRREEVLGKVWPELFLPPDQRRAQLKSFAKWVRAHPRDRYEGPIVTKSGEIRTILWSNTAILGSYEEEVVAIAIGHDITERKRVEEALRGSEERYRTLYENAPIGIYRTTPDGRILMANPTLIRMLRFSSFDELASRNLEEEGFEATYPRRQFKEWIEREGEVVGLEAAWVRRDNSVIFVRENAKAVPGEDGDVLYYEGTVEDITERKKAEEALERERHRLFSVLDVLPAYVYVQTADYSVPFVNRKFRELFGDPGDRPCYEVFHGRSEPCKDCLTLRVLKTRASQSYEWTSKDGRVYMIFEDLFPTIDGPEMVVEVGIDITERKKAEEETKAQSHFLESLIEQSPLPTFVIDSEGICVMVNKAFLKAYGVPQKEMVLGRNALTEPANVRQGVVKYIKEALSGKIVETPEIEFISPYEDKMTVTKSRLFPIFDPTNSLTNVVVLHEDVTERKRAEEEIRKLSQYLESIIDNANVWLDVLDEKANVVIWNKASEEISGYSREEVVGHGKIWEWLYPDEKYRNEITTKAAAIIEKGEVVEDFETTIRCKNGEIKTISWNSRNLLGADGESIGSIALGRDITERKQAEGKLKEAYDIINRSPAVAFLWKNDEGWPVELVSDNVKSLFGYTAEEFTSGEVPYARIVHPDDLDRVAGEVTRYSEEKGRKKFTHEPYRIITKEGEIKYVDDRTYIRRDEKGRITHYQGIVEDITQRKRAEEEIQRVSGLNQAVIDDAPIGIIAFDREGRITRLNRRHLEIDRSTIMDPKKFIGFNIFEHPTVIANGIVEPLRKILDGESFDIEIDKFNTLTAEISVSIKGVPLTRGNGEVIGGLVMDEDMTERRRAEEALRESELRYRTVFKNAPVGIGMSSLDGQILTYNDAMRQMTGYSDAELRQINLQDTYQNPEERVQLLRLLKKKGSARNFEAGLKRKDSSSYVANLTITQLTLGGKEVVLTIAEDITERRQAEEELQRTHFAIDSAPEGIAWLDKDFHYIYVNEGMCRMLGYTRDELLFLKPSEIDLMFPQVPPAELWVEMRGIKSQVREGLFRRKDRTTFPVELTIDHVVFKDEEYIFAIMRDITDRKRAEETLRESERRFSTIFRSSPMAIAITRPKDGELIDVNEAWEELLGYGREEAIGHTTLELNSWVDPHARERLVSGLLEKGTVSGFEFRMRRKSGDIAHLLLSAELIEIAGESSMLSMALDITERKRAEEILRESEQRLSAFMNSATDGILIFDSELNLVEANKSALKILGLNKTDVIGRNILDMSPDVRDKDSYDRYLKVMKSDEPFSIDNLVLHPKFGEKHLTIKVFKVGEGLGVIGTDITEQKKMEAQLIQAERLSAVGTLSYGIAHEFNNILAGILCNAEFGMGNDDPKEVEECFRIIMEGCDRAKSITNGLLAFSRQREAKRERADVTEAVNTVLGLIDRELEKHNIKVVRKFRPVPEIACDLGDLSGVFLNMITNARDAMRPDGGTLTIEIGKKRDNIEIIFTDTGCGIPGSIKSRIFEPFVTTKGALGQSEIPGTGLGLFLSYGIISRYHGEIGVKNEVEKGSRFTIKIPISKNQVSPALVEPEEEKQAVVPQNINILLVDDEKPICDAIKKFLENKGYNVTTTLSGKKGFKIFKKGGFDLVLADITIPDMDGVELILKLKEIDQQVKFIVLTGHIAEDKLESAKKAGADHILMKPFRNEELYEAVGRVLSV